ncbi:TetR/AcrR family transcriptional regulator C-terminal domain-containing protein [Mycobacterium sp. 94-17]|uniref:TetR/AcrR family transcriptional regulator C-terminal domain-containing protein n=1 Tax=Mycobacterium sp. 94-17 TaxID=2986147 RepID=UPI002D1F6F0C|nr:TetR family transcriptional regulator [Mycobacterium sp. 94-17]MEB4208036.1 TetR family transcriptional regulator [Mycobacterium sp. 94-17]
MPGTAAAPRRAYGELDRERVVAGLLTLARRVGVQRVTMRELANELGAAAPSVYYHVPGKRAALNLLAEAVLADIPEPRPGRWDERIVELYVSSRAVLRTVPGIAAVLQTNGDGASARRLDQSSRSLVARAGLAAADADASHMVLYTYLLGSVSLEETRPITVKRPTERQAAARFRAGLDVIVAGIHALVGAT